MAFVFAVFIVVVTLVVAFVASLAHADGQNPLYSPGWILVIGLAVAVVVAASHWWHVSW